jgi:hypothetical protein
MVVKLESSLVTAPLNDLSKSVTLDGVENDIQLIGEKEICQGTSFEADALDVVLCHDFDERVVSASRRRTDKFEDQPSVIL